VFTKIKWRKVLVKSFIELKNVKKNYTMGEVTIKAVDDISFSIDKGEFVVVLGASGAGKTTILNLLGGMDQVSDGSIYVDGNEISKYNKRMLTKYRREDIGFVFQFYNLVQNLNALENVELAVEICKNPMNPVEVLKNVGLEGRIQNFPSQLSGGEQQRVSIARALAKNPKLLLCDEPTGALDYNTGKSILKLLSDTSKRYDMTVVVITHNSAIAPIADTVITVKNGKVESIKKNSRPMSIESIEW
jgi:putative ABC transport system ATP-binding protein